MQQTLSGLDRTRYRVHRLKFDNNCFPYLRVEGVGIRKHDLKDRIGASPENFLQRDATRFKRDVGGGNSLKVSIRQGVYPFTFPIGMNLTTGMLRPAAAVAAIT